MSICSKLIMLKISVVFGILFTLISAVMVGAISRTWSVMDSIPNDPLVVLAADRSYRRAAYLLPSADQRAIYPLVYDGRTFSEVSCAADGRLLRFVDQGTTHWYDSNGETSEPQPGFSSDGVPPGHVIGRYRGVDFTPLAAYPSPDGKWILYEMMARLGYYNTELWLVPADGSQPARWIGDGAQSAWSPDSTLVAYSYEIWHAVSSNGTHSEYRIGLIDVQRGVSVRLPRLPFRAQYPVWTPDGSQLVVVAVGMPPNSTVTSGAMTGPSLLYAMAPDGRNPRLLTAVPNIIGLCFLRFIPAGLVEIGQ